MFDYKFAQDRFFDQLRDFTDFAEASERERQQKYKIIIDKTVKSFVEAEMRSGPRKLDSGLSEISIVFQAAVPRPVAPKYTTSGVRRPSELCRRRPL